METAEDRALGYARQLADLRSHGDHVSTCMDLTRELVALLADLAAHPRPLFEEWWETDGYRALMARKADLVARLEQVDT